MSRRQTEPPSKGVEDAGNPFHQNEGDQPPTQQAKVPPQSIESDFPDQKGQQNDSQKNAADMEFLHDDSLPSTGNPIRPCASRWNRIQEAWLWPCSLIDFENASCLNFSSPSLPLLGGFFNGLLLQTHLLQERLVGFPLNDLGKRPLVVVDNADAIDDYVLNDPFPLS